MLCLIRPKVSTFKGFELFQRLHYDLTLHFTSGLQSAFYNDQLESPTRNPKSKISLSHEKVFLLRNENNELCVRDRLESLK